MLRDVNLFLSTDGLLLRFANRRLHANEIKALPQNAALIHHDSPSSTDHKVVIKLSGGGVTECDLRRFLADDQHHYLKIPNYAEWTAADKMQLRFALIERIRKLQKNPEICIIHDEGCHLNKHQDIARLLADLEEGNLYFKKVSVCLIQEILAKAPLVNIETHPADSLDFWRLLKARLQQLEKNPELAREFVISTNSDAEKCSTSIGLKKDE